jgi:hypothetical protein
MTINTDIMKKYVNIKLEKSKGLAESLARVSFFLFPYLAINVIKILL